MPVIQTVVDVTARFHPFKLPSDQDFDPRDLDPLQNSFTEALYYTQAEGIPGLTRLPPQPKSLSFFSEDHVHARRCVARGQFSVDGALGTRTAEVLHALKKAECFESKVLFPSTLKPKSEEEFSSFASSHPAFMRIANKMGSDMEKHLYSGSNGHTFCLLGKRNVGVVNLLEHCTPIIYENRDVSNPLRLVTQLIYDISYSILSCPDNLQVPHICLTIDNLEPRFEVIPISPKLNRATHLAFPHDRLRVELAEAATRDDAEGTEVAREEIDSSRTEPFLSAVTRFFGAFGH